MKRFMWTFFRYERSTSRGQKRLSCHIFSISKHWRRGREWIWLNMEGLTWNRPFFLTTGCSSNRISRQENAWQFIDHQHDEAAVSLNQANHQVHILFVRACINVCLSLWKTVTGRQHDLPVRCRGESRPACCPNMAAYRTHFSVYC